LSACKVAAIKRVDVQRYVTKRTPNASAHSVQKELNVPKKKGILDFGFHDLRHTAVGCECKARIFTPSLTSGHKALRMASRYQHLSPSFLAEAVGRLDAVFGELRYQDVTPPKMLKAVPL
jgi:integrase